MSAELIREAADFARQLVEHAVCDEEREHLLKRADEFDSLAASMDAAEPKAWINFADNGNVRIWTSNEDVAALRQEHGFDMQPLYLHPADDAWQPIAIAPKDKGRYMCAVKTDDGNSVHECYFDGAKWMFDGEPVFAHSYYFEPYLWRELPKPPIDVAISAERKG